MIGYSVAAVDAHGSAISSLSQLGSFSVGRSKTFRALWETEVELGVESPKSFDISHSLDV